MKLTVNVGGMFSGKSTELQRQGKRHMMAGHKVVFLKPAYDNRYRDDKIVTHDGQYVEAINVTNTITNKASVDADVILIDEAQFLPYGILNEIRWLLREGKTIYISGLDMDSNGRGYLVMEGLMTMADNVQKFKAVCEECGADATFTGKRVNNGVRHELGSKELYIPLCRKCYYSYNGR